MARDRREGAAPKDEKGGPQFPTERHRRASSQELRYVEAYFKLLAHGAAGEEALSTFASSVAAELACQMCAAAAPRRPIHPAPPVFECWSVCDLCHL